MENKPTVPKQEGYEDGEKKENIDIESNICLIVQKLVLRRKITEIKKEEEIKFTAHCYKNIYISALRFETHQLKGFKWIQYLKNVF